jgi:hypothetical protein
VEEGRKEGMRYGLLEGLLVARVYQMEKGRPSSMDGAHRRNEGVETSYVEACGKGILKIFSGSRFLLSSL